MNRRRFFGADATAAAASALTGCRFTIEQGLLNDCRAPRGHSVLRDRLVRAAGDGVDPRRVWDCHVHLFGNGLSRTGIYLNPDFDRPANLAGRVRRAMFLNASCGDEDDERFDGSVADRIAHLVDELPAGVKVMLLAFDDRVIAADTGGNIWRINVDYTDATTNPNNLPSSRSIDKVAALGPASGSNARKFLGAPDVVVASTSGVPVPYDTILIGSGDREQPFDTSITNRFYMLKDAHSRMYRYTTPLTEATCSTRRTT